MLLELRELIGILRNRRLEPAALQALQEQRLRSVIRNACEHVPYYQALFKSAGLSADDVCTVADLAQVPVTRKPDLRAAGIETCLARGTDTASCCPTRTSGSTGMPMVYYTNRDEARTRRLIGLRALRAAGYRVRDRFCGMGGSPEPRLRLHHRLGFFRKWQISPLLPTREKLERLRRIRPTILRAWPSMIRAVLREADFRLHEFIQPRMVITSGEVRDEWLVEQIRSDLKAEIFNFYVASEFGEIASDCPAHEGLHVNADFLILECLNDTGESCRPGEVGNVVVTSLYGRTMPLIRFRVGDLCAPVGKPCSCGCAFPLISAPIGRETTLIVLPSGARRHTFGISSHIWKLDCIRQFQLIQESLEEFRLLLVPARGLGAQTLEQIRSQVLEYLAEPVLLDIRIVESIPEERAKFRWFISKLDSSLVR